MAARVVVPPAQEGSVLRRPRVRVDVNLGRESERK